LCPYYYLSSPNLQKCRYWCRYCHDFIQSLQIYLILLFFHIARRSLIPNSFTVAFSYPLNFRTISLSSWLALYDASCGLPFAASRRWQELTQRKNQTKYRNFLFLFFAGYSFLFPSLSSSPTILKESGKHYFVIRGSFSLRTCCMTSQPNGIQVLLHNIVKLNLQPNCNVGPSPFAPNEIVA
jgi:hypothetical protein